MTDRKLSILITGASGSIGGALAIRYARPGNRLFLSCRDAERLKDVAAQCTARGATTHTQSLDVTDRDLTRRWIEEADRAVPIDLLYANAGIAEPTAGYSDEERIRRVFDVNLTGVLNTVIPALSPMRKRRRGHIVIVSSIAGFRGLPMSPAYSASKCAVKAWGEGLRPLLESDMVNVSVVCPGYVVSPMTDKNKFPMPGLLSAERAAEIIVRGIERNRARIVFPLRMHLVSWIVGALPPAMTDWFLGRVTRWRLAREASVTKERFGQAGDDPACG